MKKDQLALTMLWLLSIPAVLASAGCASPNAAQGAPTVQVSQQPQGIWVSGSGDVMAVPDIATLRLGIVSQEAAVADAQTRAADAMNRVMKALTDGGVPQKDIQTGSFNINQRTRYDQSSQTDVVVGYQVSNMITARIRMLPQESSTLDYKAGRVIEAVVAAGGNLIRVSGISFSVEDPTKYYQQAREKAMADARNKAEQLARLAGVSLGKPVYVAEGAQPPVVYDSYRSASLAVPAPVPAMAPPISAGETRITLTVQVAYSAVP